MKLRMRLVAVLLMAVVLAGALAGCKTPSGSREYRPGQGWIDID